MTNLQLQSDDKNSASASSLLTVEDIIRYKADYEADLKLLDELPARIKQKKRKYEAALFFAPDGFDPDVSLKPAVIAVPDLNYVTTPIVREPVTSPSFELGVQQQSKEPEETETRLTWIGELARVLDASPKGISHQDALTQLKKTKLGERVSQGEKGFYNAVALLDKRGGLVKAGGLLYSANVIEQMKARGESIPDESVETRRRSGGSGAATLQVLRSHPQGLDANTLRSELAKAPGAPASIAKHGHYIYNILGSLMGQGAIEKDANGIYKLALGA